MRIGNVAGLGVALLLLLGCSATSVSNTPDSSTPAAPAALATTDAPTPTTETPAVAKVGDAITLKGSAGSEIAVVVTNVVDPTKSTDGFSTPTAGNRYVAVQFRITNTGTAAYTDVPMNGAKVADADGQQFTSTVVMSVAAGPTFPVTVALIPGGKALGYIVFQVPTTSKITAVQFGMDSGFGSTGEWAVS
jgi:hypothetical protein